VLLAAAVIANALLEEHRRHAAHKSWTGMVAGVSCLYVAAAVLVMCSIATALHFWMAEPAGAPLS